MSMSSLYEKRPLKKPRIGPPDVYPQDPKQKEDELTSLNVKHGFTLMPQLSDEFGTARHSNVTASKVGAYFNAIIARKEELCTLQDSGRKRQQINTKDNFWPAIVRNKHYIEAWFKDLAGNKPLITLGKRAPNFNKKEEIFIMLSEYQVPMLRAAWFIKLSSAYTIAVSEAKNKKRQLPDPTTEWTGTLIKFLKDQIPKLLDFYNMSSALTINGAAPISSPSSTGNNTPGHVPVGAGTPTSAPASENDCKIASRQWSYCTELTKYMYEEGLLDRQEVLNFIMELLDRMRTQPAGEDNILKLYLPLTLQYIDEFVQSELLSRRIAYLCAKKLAYLCNNVAADIHLGSSTPSTNENKEQIDGKDKREVAVQNPLQATIAEYLNCPHHRDIVLQLAAIIQIITLECPTALVWCGIGENRTHSLWHGSPLDCLPVSPSQLPLPTRSIMGVYSTDLSKRLRSAENLIRDRSRRAEGRWCADKWQSSSAGMTTTKVLAALDALDRHRFDRVDTSNSLDTLYAKIFTPSTDTKTKDQPTPAVTTSPGNPVQEKQDIKTEYNPVQDEAIIQILCEWAVSHERWGEHRAMAVAWLLDKRQADVTASAENDVNMSSDDKDSVSSLNNQPTGLPIFQNLLMKFLDTDAPILEDNGNGSPQNRTMFTNLVHLFAELIRHDVFSHDAYMCTLISRGDLLLCTSNNILINGGIGVHNRPPTPPPNPGLDDEIFGLDLKSTKLDIDHGLRNPSSMVTDCDDSKIDDELDKLLQHIKEDQQSSLDAPDSPKDDHHHHNPHHQHNHHTSPAQNQSTHNPIMDTTPSNHDQDLRKQQPSRHLLYTTHFPLSQDEMNIGGAQHDCNQRHVLLYGVGKVRDEARHTVKKMSKEICKLFSKKFSIDVAEGGKVKKHSRNEFNFENTTQKCQSLSYFDQHVVTWQCSLNVIEMLNSFALGNSNYLPVQEHVAFLFDLMELALNIYGLIDVCISILKELPEVEAQLLAKNSTLARNYTTTLSLYVVGVLRRYHCCLLLSADQTWQVFDGLCKVVKHVSTPGDCSSAERCVLAHLYDLYSSCHLLKAKPHTEFANAYPKIRQALYSALQPTASNNYVYNIHYMQELFANPRRGKFESNWARQLAESPNNRYSFVTNAIITVCRETDNERLNELSVMCAEVTACFNALSAEWVGALMALCCSTNSSNFYMDLLTHVDVQDISIHNSLAVFTSILIARHCFSLEDFVKHIALPTLVKVSKAFNDARGDSVVVQSGASNVEAGARLTCHLLLRLFKTIECPQPGLYSVSTSPHPLPTAVGSNYSIRLSCDRHLLAAAHNNIKVGPVLAVLKAILVVGDATAREGKNSGKRDGNGSSSHSGSCSSGKTLSSGPGELSISHILGTSDILGGGDDGLLDITMVDLETTSSRTSQRQSVSSEGPSSLSKFAWHVLREICSQQWVLERCLSQPEELFQSDMLLDPMLTSSQAQRLLHMICYPDISSTLDELDQKSIITRILENLEQWTLRMSWLDLQLMFKQFNANSSELNQWLDTVAKAAIDVFQLSNENGSSQNSGANANGNSGGIKYDTASSKYSHNTNHTNNYSISSNSNKSGSIWLVAPLVSKLPSAVQGRVLKVAGQVLETNNWPAGKQRSSGNENQKDMSLRNQGSQSSTGNQSTGLGSKHHNRYMTGNNSSSGNVNTTGSGNGEQSTSLLSHQPFLSLVLTCLKGQDDQREGLLTSLHSQLSQFLTLSKDERVGTCEVGSRESMLDALQLRFSLVGGMFDTVQRSTATTTDWAVLLVQLISYGIVDLNNNSELFSTVIDMLATLVHSTLVSDSQTEKDENKKHYQNLMKKLKKELGDRNSASIQHVRQLLQLPKRTCEVIACEPVGCLTDTKGNKITGFDSIDKKQGLRVADKQRVSPWDLLEGQKSPAPLSWSWFGAVRLERKPLWYEDTHRLLKYHTHSLLRSPSHYLDPVPLPPEDLEPIQDKPFKDHDFKADTPSSIVDEASPRSAALGKVRGKNQRRSRKPKIPMMGGIGPCAGGAVPGAGVGVNAPGATGGVGMMVSPGQQQMLNQHQQQQAMQQHNQQQQNQMGMPNMVGMQQQGGQIGNYGGQMGNAGPQQNFGGNQGQQQWGYNPQQTAQQQGYYGQMPVNRYERPQINQSKQALCNMLRQRHPINQYLGSGGGATPAGGGVVGPMGGAYVGGMQRQFPRQQMRGGPQQVNPGPATGPGQNMFQQQQYNNMQQGVNQNYAGYGNAGTGAQQGQLMQNTGAGGGPGNQQAMMGNFQAQQTPFGPQGGNTGIGAPPNAAAAAAAAAATMMGNQRGIPPGVQGDYLPQQQQRMGQNNRPQYLQAPNVTMNTMGGLPGNQGGPAPPYSRAVAGGGQPGVQPNQQFQQQVNHQRIRQQMMAIQQQQSAGGGGNQSSSTIVSHLQRSMQQPNQQHNPYGHQPPQYQ